MAFPKDIHFPRVSVRREKRPAVVVNESFAKIRAQVDDVWDQSWQKAESLTTIVSTTLRWDDMNKPDDFDSAVVVTELANLVAQSTLYGKRYTQTERPVATNRLRYQYEAKKAQNAEDFPQETAALAKATEQYFDTARKAARLIWDIENDPMAKTHERANWELAGPLHLLLHIRGKTEKTG